MRTAPRASSSRRASGSESPGTPGISRVFRGYHFSRAVAVLAVLAVAVWVLAFTEVASAAANTVYAVACTAQLSSESFNCSDTHVPLAGSFEYDITFTGDVSGQNGIRDSFVSLRCPNIAGTRGTSGVAGSTPSIWRTSGAGAGGGGFTSEVSYLGNMPFASDAPINVATVSVYADQTTPVYGAPTIAVEGTWQAGSVQSCVLEVYGIIDPSAYSTNLFKAANHTDEGQLHTDLTGTLATSCAACATSANQTTENSSLSQIHTDLTGTLATSCAACSTSANQTTENSNIVSFKNANHTDLTGTLLTSCSACSTSANQTTGNSYLSSILSALGGSLTTSCGGCAQNSTLASFQTATHSDAGDIYKAIAWALGLLIVLLIVPIFMKIFSRVGIRD